MLAKDEDVQELIKLKSDKISESDSDSSTMDLDETWCRAEEHVVNIFLDKFLKAENYVWGFLDENQPEVKDANRFICILGFILSKGEPERLPGNMHNKNFYTIGLSYLSGLFCLANQIVKGGIVNSEEIRVIFQQNDLAVKALKHYIHNNAQSPYFDYYRPFSNLESKTQEEVIKLLSTDKELITFIEYCEEEWKRLFGQLTKIFSL